MITGFISLAALVHAAVFICYPQSGRLGATFTFISLLLWSAFGILLFRPVSGLKTSDKAGVLVTYAVACALAALSLLPQKDGVSPLSKLADGLIPTKTEIYTGLLRLGIDYPALLPPKKEEPPVI
jgi:hypothetical protein